MLWCLATLKTSIAIIKEASYLARLIDLRQIVEWIVAVSCSRVDSLVPVQLIHLLQPPERISRVFLAPAAFVSNRGYFPARTATAAIRILPGRTIGQRRERRTALPVVAVVGLVPDALVDDLLLRVAIGLVLDVRADQELRVSDCAASAGSLSSLGNCIEDRQVVLPNVGR